MADTAPSESQAYTLLRNQCPSPDECLTSADYGLLAMRHIFDTPGSEFLC